MASGTEFDKSSLFDEIDSLEAAFDKSSLFDEIDNLEAAFDKSSLFDEIDSLEAAFFILEVIIFVPTVFGNILILVSMNKYIWLKSPLNSLIENLAVGDLLIGVLLIPLSILGTFLGLNRLWHVCLLQLAIFVTLILVSLLTMLAISIERYFSVAFPWRHKRSKRYRFVYTFIPLCWVFSLSFSMVPFFGWHDFVDGESRCLLLHVWTIEIRSVLSALIIVVVIVKIVLFSLVVNIAVKNMPNHTDRDEHIRLRRQLAKTYMLIAISAIFILCWAPYCLVTFFQIFMDIEVLKLVQGWTLLLGLFNAGINWLIYGLKNHKFRHAFKLLLCKEQNIRNSTELES